MKNYLGSNKHLNIIFSASCFKSYWIKYSIWKYLFRKYAFIKNALSKTGKLFARTIVFKRSCPLGYKILVLPRIWCSARGLSIACVRLSCWWTTHPGMRMQRPIRVGHGRQEPELSSGCKHFCRGPSHPATATAPPPRPHTRGATRRRHTSRLQLSRDLHGHYPIPPQLSRDPCAVRYSCCWRAAVAPPLALPTSGAGAEGGGAAASPPPRASPGMVLAAGDGPWRRAQVSAGRSPSLSVLSWATQLRLGLFPPPPGDPPSPGAAAARQASGPQCRRGGTPGTSPRSTPGPAGL